LLLLGDQSGVWVWDLSRVRDDTRAVPALPVEQTSDSSTDRAVTAQIVDQQITLQTRSGQHSLVAPVQVPLRRLGLCADRQHLVAESPDSRAWIWDLASRTLIGPPQPTRYEVGQATQGSLHLPVDGRDRRTLSDLAALLAGQRPDGAGGTTPVDEAERTRLFGKLRGLLPAEFCAAEANRARWHEAQAHSAEQAMDWDAAGFHWGQVAQLKPEAPHPKPEGAFEIPAPRSEVAGVAATAGPAPSEIPVESRLAYARQANEAVRQVVLKGGSRWSVILPRPAWAASGMLDLGRYYTLRLAEPLPPGPRGVSFRELASGVHVLGGTGFDVRGVVQLSPTNPVAIPVGRACQRLHFLQATWVAARSAGTRAPAGRYQVTYANGERVDVRLMKPDDVPPHSASGFYEVSSTQWQGTSPSLRCALVWSGSSAGWGPKKERLFLTRTT
jgi:hypothetical protein